MAESTHRQQYALAWRGHWLYRELFDWYGDAYLRAKSPRPPWEPPAFEPAMRGIVARADREWAELTGLPALDACDPNTWWAAAISAGRQGQPVANVRRLSVRALAEIILPWAMAKKAEAGAMAKKAEAGDDTEFLKVRTSDVANYFDVTAKTIREWRDSETAPRRIKPAGCRGYVLVHPDDWKI